MFLTLYGTWCQVTNITALGDDVEIFDARPVSRCTFAVVRLQDISRVVPHPAGKGRLIVTVDGDDFITSAPLPKPQTVPELPETDITKGSENT